MNTADKISADIKSAMLARDSTKLDLLNMLKTALQYEAIKSDDKQLSEEKVIAVLQRERKKRLDAAELYANNQQIEKSDREKAEAEVISQYLPEQMNETEIKALVEQAIAQTGAKDVKDMGKVMGVVKASSAGRADGGQVAAIVKQILGDN